MDMMKFQLLPFTIPCYLSVALAAGLWLGGGGGSADGGDREGPDPGAGPPHQERQARGRGEDGRLQARHRAGLLVPQTRLRPRQGQLGASVGLLLRVLCVSVTTW